MNKLALGFNTAAQDSNPGFRSRESEALPLSHCAATNASGYSLLFAFQVLVLSFALFLGAWSPLTGGGMGQPSIGPMPMPVTHGMGGIRGNIASTLARDANKVPMGPEIGDPYSTPSGMCQFI